MASAASSVNPGLALDRYKVLAEIGQGGMAQVYLAVVHGIGGFQKLHVLKRLRKELAAETEIAAMFLDEARLAARLNHPNIVQTYEVGVAEGRYFMTMEYLEGQPLDRLIRRAFHAPGEQRPPGIATRLALHIASKICAGLHYAHDLKDLDGSPLNVVHRDVSPHNVFVTYEGHVKVMDFGIAVTRTRTTRTETGILKGKVAYMAPEHAQGLALDRRADVFSAGMVLFEVLTGERLYPGQGDIEILRGLLNGRGPAAVNERLGRAKVPAGVAHLVQRALASKPDDRYASAHELRRDIEGALDEMGGASEEALGACVSALFSEERAQVAALIERQLRSVGVSSVSALDGLDANLPRLVAPGSEGLTPSRGDAAPPEGTVVLTPSRRTHRVAVVPLVAAVGVGMLLAATGAVLLARSRASAVRSGSVPLVATSTSSREESAARTGPPDEEPAGPTRGPGTQAPKTLSSETAGEASSAVPSLSRAPEASPPASAPTGARAVTPAAAFATAVESAAPQRRRTPVASVPARPATNAASQPPPAAASSPIPHDPLRDRR